MVLVNGRIPLNELTPLGWPEVDHLRLRADAAAAIWRVAWRFELRFGKPLFITDAYRDYDTQVRLKKQKGPFAATPGKSNHGWGVALDMASRINVDGSAEHDWFVREARAHGWVWPPWASDFNPNNGQHEPWHMEYHPELDQRKGERNDDFPLVKGSTGFRVIELQRRLGLQVDGILGAAGERAVKGFQASRGLTPDGKVGPATWTELTRKVNLMAYKDTATLYTAPDRGYVLLGPGLRFELGDKGEGTPTGGEQLATIRALGFPEQTLNTVDYDRAVWIARYAETGGA